MRANLARRRTGTVLTLLVLLGAGACHREERPRSQGAIVREELRFVGRLVLEGALGRAHDGGICVRLVEGDTGRVLLQRVYDLGDPSWDRWSDRQALYFALTPADAFDAEAPVRAPIVLEAFHLPPGTNPGDAELAGEPSDRVREQAVPGRGDVELVLSSAASVASGATGGEDARDR